VIGAQDQPLCSQTGFLRQSMDMADKPLGIKTTVSALLVDLIGRGFHQQLASIGRSLGDGGLKDGRIAGTQAGNAWGAKKCSGLSMSM
jgi:hypothetical protein